MAKAEKRRRSRQSGERREGPLLGAGLFVLSASQRDGGRGAVFGAEFSSFRVFYIRESDDENENEKQIMILKKLSLFLSLSLSLSDFSKLKQEHSSFPELRAAVAAMKPRRLVPTVTGGEFEESKVFLEREKRGERMKKLTFFSRPIFSKKIGTAGDREAIVQRFSDLLDRKRDRSRLDFFFSSKKKDEEEEKASAEEEDEGGEFFEVKVEDGKCAAAAVNNDDIEGKEERGSDDEGDDDDSWGPLRGGDEWALDDDEDEETKEEEGEARKKKEREKAAAAAGGPSAAPLPPPPLPPPPPVPFDLSSVDAQEQRRILAEIHAVATAEKLLRDQREGNGKRRRQPTLAAFAAATAAGKKKKE